MQLIRIQSDELQEIIRDKLISVAILDEEDADECLIAIMEEVAKSNPFKVWRR